MSATRIEIYLHDEAAEDKVVLAARRSLNALSRGRAQAVLRRALYLGIRELRRRGELGELSLRTAPAPSEAVPPAPSTTAGSALDAVTSGAPAPAPAAPRADPVPTPPLPPPSPSVEANTTLPAAQGARRVNIRSLM